MPHPLSHKYPIPISQLCLVNTDVPCSWCWCSSTRHDFLFTFPNIPSFPLTFLPPFQPSPFFLSTSPSPLFSELAPRFLYYEEGREEGKKMQWVEHTPGTQYGDFLATYGLHVRDQLYYSTWLNTKMLTSALMQHQHS